ncbi:tetraspanin-4-like [Rhinatrema bivittatum]|uniref:tetraspanin-4-like n=1 Tax=Rhinatrema bivittatum TaxID=194408 RepID=UPI001127462A|nr:tetraspanin-4-like [Rhinatrema bivittatum]XP_029440016.1 tetraspanin-4-like [Rhinatrema bivittatum]
MSTNRGCLLCIKIKMFIFNLIFWLGGCGILGVGIWLAVTQGKFATLSYSFPSLSAASLFMVTGSMIMVVGFIGCLGAVTENRCLLLTFFILLLIIFLLEIITMLLFVTYRDEFHSYAQEDLKKGLRLYKTEGNLGLTTAWNTVQTEFRCCGVKNYTDWFEMRNETEVPDSCCLEYSPTCQSDPNTWWKDPCYKKVKLWLGQNISSLGAFAICIVVIQVLGLVFSMFMYCQVLRAEKYYE